MYRIGIECHNLENRRWGIGRHLSKVLEEIAKLADKSELANEFRFYLYFKGHIPDDAYLNHSIFAKRVLKPAWFPRHFFNIFFHLLLPRAYCQDQLNAMFFPSFMLPALFTGKSLVVLTNDIYYEYTEGALPWRYKLGYRFFSNWAARHASLLTVYTQYAKREVGKLFRINPERIVVNYLGIDREQFRSARPQTKKNYLLYVGQAFHRRRVKETIEAFALIAPKFSELNLIIVGQDKYHPPILRELVAQTNQTLGQERVRHYSYIQSDEELLKLYQEARLCVYLSSAEAMGLPPLEALASGTPALVKDDHLNREIYEDCAFYSESETDPQIIAKAMENALRNSDRQKEILGAADRIVARFNWSHHVKNLLEYFRLLSK